MASAIEVRCLAASLIVVAGLPVTLTGAGGLDADGVIAGCAFDIVEVEAHGALVATDSRNRGSVAVSTTGSRTVTSTVARPSLVAFRPPPSRGRCRRIRDLELDLAQCRRRPR